MRAGSLDRRVTQFRKVEVGRDGYNSPIVELRPIRRLWAGIVHKAADEAFAAEQRYAQRVLTFQTRYIDVESTDVLELDGHRYDVKGWRELGRREGLEITAEWQE